MKNCLIALVILFCGMSFANAQEVTPDKPNHPLINVVTPELYQVKITLDSGEVIILTKVALTSKSLEKKLVFRVVFDKRIRVVPDGEDKFRTIKASELDKIEITKMKDVEEDKPSPEKVPQIINP